MGGVKVIFKRDPWGRSFRPGKNDRFFFLGGFNNTSSYIHYCFPCLFSSSIRFFIPFAILWFSRYSIMHVRQWNRPGCSLFCIRMKYSDASLLKIIPQFRHFAYTLGDFCIGDTVLETYSITSLFFNHKFWRGTGAMHANFFIIVVILVFRS